MSVVLRISSSIRTDFENIWFPHQHLHIKKKKNRRISPSLSKTSRFLENEPAKKKTTLASPFLPQGKRNFLPKTSLRKFRKNKKPSSLKTFIGNNHVTEKKIWRKRNFPRRRKKRRKFKIGRKKKNETASPSTPRLSIDAKTTTFDMEDMKKRKSHRYENYKDYLGHAHFSTHWKHLWRFSNKKNTCKKNSSSTSVYFHLAALILRLRKCLSACENIWGRR